MKLTQKKVNQLFLKAIEQGDLIAVKYLLNDCPIKADLYVKNEVEDPLVCLLEAVSANQLEILTYLLENTELKKYTGLKGHVDFYDADVGYTILMMYERAGHTGNIELIEYLNEKLYWENKYDLFACAAFDNHVNVLDYIIKKELLTDKDKEQLSQPKNKVIENALKNNAKQSVNFLLNYYKKNQPDILKNELFIINNLVKTIESRNCNDQDFELFDMFYNQKLIQKNQEILLSKKIFQQIVKRHNVDLFKHSLKQITDKELKKKLIIDSYCFAVEDYGTLKDYPLYEHIIENYKSYFSKEDKENIFYSLIYAKDRARFHDLIKYDFLLKGTDPNNILKETIKHIRVEDTFEYITDILSSVFNKKIKIHFEDNYFFKVIKKELENDKIVELLQVIVSNGIELNMKKIETLFSENQEITNFISKKQLNTKLQDNLPIKNNKVKTNKI